MSDLRAQAVNKAMLLNLDDNDCLELARILIDDDAEGGLASLIGVPAAGTNQSSDQARRRQRHVSK